jgi:hypothetical protein
MPCLAGGLRITAKDRHAASNDAQRRRRQKSVKRVGDTLDDAVAEEACGARVSYPLLAKAYRITLGNNECSLYQILRNRPIAPSP